MKDDRPSEKCRGPYGEAGCLDEARFSVLRHRLPSLPVCPVHLGPSLLLAGSVLWPPEITMIG